MNPPEYSVDYTAYPRNIAFPLKDGVVGLVIWSHKEELTGVAKENRGQVVKNGSWWRRRAGLHMC